MTTTEHKPNGQENGLIRRWFNWSGTNWKFLTKIASVLIGGVLLALVFRGVLFAPTSIGSPSSESDALIRANERLLEMTKWTISTILILGTGLIGLNWYSNEHRYARDRAENESQIGDLQKTFKSAMADETVRYLDLHKQLLEMKFEVHEVRTQIVQELLYPGNEFPKDGYAQQVLELIEGHHVVPGLKKQILDHFLSSFDKEENETLFLRFLGLDYLPMIAEAAERNGFTAEAKKARTAYERLTSGRTEGADDPDQPQ